MAEGEARGGALGVIAGTGALPRVIAEDCAARGAPVFIIRFEGIDAPWADAFAHADIPYEKPGRLFKALRGAGCDRICFAGAMTRPKLNPLKFDAKALSLAPRALMLLTRGDDEMLRGFGAMLEVEGLTMVGAHELMKTLLAPDGVIGALVPTDTDRSDAERAAKIVAALGAVDVGQGAVVAGGICLGVEAIAGTDALLAQVAGVPAHLRPEGRAGVLFKGPKPGQDRRMDLPAIGPATLRAAAAAGLSGVCVAKGGVLLLGRTETAAEADRLGLALWSVGA
ncbi:MAG: DUF1009 family protein [Paracoccaceae bacterium]